MATNNPVLADYDMAWRDDHLYYLLLETMAIKAKVLRGLITRTAAVKTKIAQFNK